MAGPRGTRLSRVVPHSPTRKASCAAPRSLSLSLSLDGHGGGHTPPPPLRHPLAAIGYAALPASPSPRRRCNFTASPAPRPRIWERTGRLPLRSGLSLGSPSGTTAPPPSLSRQAAADCSLLPFLSPSSNDGRLDAADLLGSRADKRRSARLVSFPAASRPVASTHLGGSSTNQGAASSASSKRIISGGKSKLLRLALSNLAFSIQ